MLKVSSGNELKAPRGSLRSFRVSSPVLVMVVVTFKFSNPSTRTLGTEVLMVRPGVAETATTEAMRAMKEARREEENIVTKVVNAVDEMTPIEAWDWVKYQPFGPHGETAEPIAYTEEQRPWDQIRQILWRCRECL